MTQEGVGLEKFPFPAKHSDAHLPLQKDASHVLPRRKGLPCVLSQGESLSTGLLEEGTGKCTEPLEKSLA
jgi:hypothetical protein